MKMERCIDCNHTIRKDEGFVCAKCFDLGKIEVRCLNHHKDHALDKPSHNFLVYCKKRKSKIA